MFCKHRDNFRDLAYFAEFRLFCLIQPGGVYFFQLFPSEQNNCIGWLKHKVAGNPVSYNLVTNFLIFFRIWIFECLLRQFFLNFCTNWGDGEPEIDNSNYDNNNVLQIVS